jgi:hypothetical protein
VLKVSFCGLNGIRIYPLFGASNFSLRTREVCLDNIPNTNKRNVFTELAKAALTLDESHRTLRSQSTFGA